MANTYLMICSDSELKHLCSSGFTERYWLTLYCSPIHLQGAVQSFLNTLLERTNCHGVHNTSEYKLHTHKLYWDSMSAGRSFCEPSHLCISLDTINRQINVFTACLLLRLGNVTWITSSRMSFYYDTNVIHWALKIN